jgi:hypothetical protein
MAFAPEIEAALGEWAQVTGEEAGKHLGVDIQAGIPGRVVGYIPYEPGVHEPDAIDYLAMESIVTGKPHVPLAISEHPLMAQLIVHYDGNQAIRSDMLDTKLHLAGELAETIEESMPCNGNSDGDEVRCYIIGSGLDDITRTRRSVFRGAEVMDGIEDPEVAAKTVAEICREGMINFLLSDFYALPLKDKGPFGKTVGLKINDIEEMRVGYLAKPKISLPVGDDEKVKLWKPEEVARHNDHLHNYHQGLIDQNEAAGLAMVQITADHEQRLGFDVYAAYRAIAQAIRRQQR